MPFEKIGTKMEVLHNPEKLSTELKKGLTQLKNNSISPASFVHTLFGTLGTGSHAVYGITQALIVRDGTTTKTKIIPEVKKYIRLQLLEKDEKGKVVNASEVEKSLPHDREIEHAINGLIGKNEFYRTPGGTIKPITKKK